MISKLNFDRLEHFSKDVEEFYPEVYENVSGFEPLRKIF